MNKPGNHSPREGSALIVALWVLMILALLIGTFAFEMHIEAGIASHQRRKLHARYLARAGVAYAQLLMERSLNAKEDDVASSEEFEELVEQAFRLSRGVGISSHTFELGRGKVVIDIMPEEGRRNVNLLSDEDWEEILDQAGIPEDKWKELIDCFTDWIDDNEFASLHGAESDDPFYQDAGYEVKNAPLDTVDELRMIKGFTAEVVYGRPPDADGQGGMPGIARWLTTWGDGRVNVNTASREVLLTLPGIDVWSVDKIIEGRTGMDEQAGTRYDGWESPDEVMAAAALDSSLKDRITVRDTQYLRVTAQGEVDNVRAGIWCVMEVGGEGGTIRPVYWREGDAME